MSSDQILSIIAEFKLAPDYFIWQGLNASESMDEDERLQNYYESEILPNTIDGDEDYERILALMEYTGNDWDSCNYDLDKDIYKVMTDDEATDACERILKDRIADEVLNDIPQHLRQYFDTEQYLSDCISNIDREAELASYDGDEHSESIDGTTYYIYKV